MAVAVIPLKVFSLGLRSDTQMPSCAVVIEAGDLLARNKGVSGGGDGGSDMWLHAFA
jgi:hypothetical protein